MWRNMGDAYVQQWMTWADDDYKYFHQFYYYQDLWKALYTCPLGQFLSTG